MTKPADLYKGGTVFFYAPPGCGAVEMVIVADGGPLCVGRVYDHVAGKMVVGLYWIYLKRHGAHFGPFFTDIVLAERAMKKILKQFAPKFFEQPLEWIRRQAALKEWIEKNIGRSEDLIGGEWAPPEDDASAGSGTAP